jgi:hypothetical protein
MDTTKIVGVLEAVGSLIPYVGTVTQLATAVPTIISFIEETVHIWHQDGKLSDSQWADFKASIVNLKNDPAWLTDAERGIKK